MNKINELVEWIQNIELNQIINLMIAIVLIILSIILSPILSLLITKIVHWKKNKKEIKKSVLYSNLKNFLGITGIYIATIIIEFNEQTNIFINKLYRIAIVWIIAKTVSDIFSNGKLFKSKFKDKANDPAINIINKIIKVILYIIAGYLTLKEFGYDLGVVLTGLGLSTAIIALAAQDTVRDIFSGLSIFWDKPFAIGDWVEIGDATTTVSGTVEEISFRSTKIRTMEDTVITIQNSNISTQNITNWGVISKRKYEMDLKLPLETEEITVEKIINRIKFILKYNKDIIKESVNVYFDTIANDGITIHIFLDTNITPYFEYKKFCNKINLTLLNILETQEVKLAYPGQNIYIKTTEENNGIKQMQKNTLRHHKSVKIDK